MAFEIAQHRKSPCKRRDVIDLYRAAESEVVRTMIESSLESGLSHHDAVKLAIATYKELDVLTAPTADAAFWDLTRDDLREIRMYCRAILRSGSTFQAFEIATRAIAAWKLAKVELQKLHDEWNRRDVVRKLVSNEKRSTTMKAKHADATPG